MTDAQTISILLAGLSIAASIVYYASVLRNQNKTQQLQLETRKLQIVKEIWDWISDEEGYKQFFQIMTLTWIDYDDFQKQYGASTNIEAYTMRFSVQSKLNGFGYMVKEGAIDIETVYDHSAGRVVWMWQKYKPIIYSDRKRLGASYIFKWWEYLAEELLKEAERRGDTLVTPPSFQTSPI